MNNTISSYFIFSLNKKILILDPFGIPITLLKIRKYKFELIPQGNLDWSGSDNTADPSLWCWECSVLIV